MADSFADLWTSSAPVKQTQQPQRLGASSAQKPNPPSQRPQWDAFSALSASQPTSRTHLPLQAQIQQKPVTVSQRQNVSSDAFSGLFDASMGFGSGSTKEATNMSMAEKATLAQKGKAQQVQLENGRISSQSTIPSAWDGLDSLAQTTIPVMSSAVKSPPQDDFDFTFGCAKATQKVDSGVGQDEDDWGLSDFSSPHSSARLKAQPKVQSLWDIDDFVSPSPQRSQTDSSVSSNLAVRNDRENALLDGNVREDDILGDLCKPVQNHSIRPSPPPQLAPVPSTAQQLSRTPTTSPPPHITGQLVEMGFSPQTARSALVSTCTADGFDVQAALDWLLAHGEASSPSESDNHRSGGLDSETVNRTFRGPPTRATRKPSHLGSRNAQQRQPNSDTADFPASTERFLSQAGEIGRGMFSRANALFKEGKERAVKMYEERTGASSARVAGSADGRPRWMREGSGEGGLRENKPQGGFKDENHESKSCKSRSLRSSPGDIQFQASPPATTEEVDLFGNDASQIVHQSHPPKGKPNTELTPSTSNSTSSRLLTRSPPHVPPRKLTATISSAVFGTYQSQKSAGTEAYKLGQYPAAAAAYSRALASVPEGHVLCLPLLTNRAAALSKVGELSGVAEDCSAAIALTERYMSKADTAYAKIGRMHVIVEATSGTEEGTEVDLAGGLTKAYQRRAEAYEGLEKWARALADWKVLVGAEWAGAARSLATSGIARCRRIDGTKRRPGIRPSVSSTVVPQLSKPRPKHSMVSAPIGTGESSAVAALRAAADVAASEDAERCAHKDAVDAQLLAWRQGKETNIRALLTTLDSVLWPELGWKKVGMAEVVGKGQVKVAYMRAIARVHPDKLNANNTTIEQQMIASGRGTAFLQQ
ncbi:hypothetical protein F5J12DRAFT_801808 [Pisolithus orientalis]|uniref:uncharacterized protein n=1 Tax=Pisolithus orientalis TaxID=936130 RepID=UPI002223F607|nr:uncharacterized protein F5J12DRAFT_801808 [Pisolithus orientalis]KAI6030616.1 hypothetical protein F5J12DRAFT_801808 [Pisolithus orientalis]